jgi:hypothetical protein
LRQTGDWGRRERSRLEAELAGLLTETLIEQFRRRIPDARYNKIVERLLQRRLSPWEAVKELMEK